MYVSTKAGGVRRREERWKIRQSIKAGGRWQRWRRWRQQQRRRRQWRLMGPRSGGDGNEWMAVASGGGQQGSNGGCRRWLRRRQAEGQERAESGVDCGDNASGYVKAVTAAAAVSRPGSGGSNGVVNGKKVLYSTRHTNKRKSG